MKITTMFNHINFFKCTRVFVIKLCIICFLLLLIYILRHIYYHTNFYVHISYCGDFDLYPATNTTTTKCARSHGCGDSADIICSKAIQGMGKSGSVNDTQILQHTDENQQKTLLNGEHDYMKQANNISTQKEGKQQKNDMTSKQRNLRNIGINATHINGILMEPVNANYSRNIYFTVKTTHKYYTNRLFPLMLTWLQAVDKNKLSIVSDRSPEKKSYVDMIRKAGFNLIDTNCLAAVYDNSALCCKLNHEFIAYYKAIEEHPGEGDNYQWFCHIDDDMYVNVLQLSQLLQLYDPHKPYYIGKWPISLRRGVSNLFDIHLDKRTIQRIHQKMSYTLKKVSYRYATGAIFCISYDLMMKAKVFFNPITFKQIAAGAKYSSDDVIVGFIIGVLLGYNLTDAPIMINQYDTYVKSFGLQTLIKYPTVSSTITQNDSLKKLVASLKTPLPSDPTKFMLYHCLLYPTVSWCEGIKDIYNELQL